MNRKDCILKWLSYFLIAAFFLSACNRTEPSTVEMAPTESTATFLSEPTIAPTTEPTSVEPTPEPVTEIAEVAEIPEREPGTFDFEDGAQGWQPRGEAFVMGTDDVAHSGATSLAVTDRSADWHGATISVANLLEPDTIYYVSAYVRLGDGEPCSRVILTIQRTPKDGNAIYEGIAPSDADGVTDAEWIMLEGQYTYSGEGDELMLYVESPDTVFVSF